MSLERNYSFLENSIYYQKKESQVNIDRMNSYIFAFYNLNIVVLNIKNDIIITILIQSINLKLNILKDFRLVRKIVSDKSLPKYKRLSFDLILLMLFVMKIKAIIMIVLMLITNYGTTLDSAQSFINEKNPSTEEKFFFDHARVNNRLTSF